MCTIHDNMFVLSTVNPFRTAAPFWGQTIRIHSSLSPKWDYGAKGVNCLVPGILLGVPLLITVHENVTSYCVNMVFDGGAPAIQFFCETFATAQ